MNRMMMLLDKQLTVWHYIFAGFVAIVVPMVMALVLSQTVASGCYDSLCLLPLLMLIAPPCAVPVLVALFAINRRLGKPIPDGLVPTVTISGIAIQFVISVIAVSTASAQSRDLFFSELMSVPQGLIVGFTIGAVFWIALSAFGPNSPNPK